MSTMISLAGCARPTTRAIQIAAETSSTRNLHTLNSPFFTNEYTPEAPILSAVIFYSNCNYERTRDTINEFRLTYEPLRDYDQSCDYGLDGCAPGGSFWIAVKIVLGSGT